LRESYVRLDVRTGRNKNNELHGVPSGLIDLDKLTCGFQKNELIIIAARPSVGKTALGLQLAAHAAIECGLPTLFVSLEQARTELADRLLCSFGGIGSYEMRRGNLSTDEQERLMNTGAILARSPMHLDDSAQQGMMRIASNARRLKSRADLQILFVDYLQLIDPESGNNRANRQEQVGAISRRLKFLARELQIPVVAMAQLNRGAEDRGAGRPKLSDLRESGAIEQDADTVILLHRTEENSNHDTAEIMAIVAKQRNGPTGEVNLRYTKRFMKFENAAESWRNQP
jgi:replicative DNA helicase